MTHKNILPYLFILAIAGCTAKGSEQEESVKAAELPVIKLTAADTSIYTGYVGDIQAVQNVEIRSKVTGYLEQIFIDEGKEVTKGQPLFKINDQPYRIELAKAQSILKNAEAEAYAASLEVKRVQLLVDKKIISNTELDLAKAKHKSAEARVSEAKTHVDEAGLRLSYTTIRSPFSGVIDRIPFKLGSLVNDGTLLTTVSDLSTVVAYFNVSENEYLQYFRKQLRNEKTPQDHAAELLLADGSLYKYAGKIETMESEFDESTGSIAFRAKFPNPDKLLKHGSSGKVRLTTPVENVVIVPQKAVFDIQDKNYVFVVGKDNRVHMKSFIPHTRLDQSYVVQSGLQPGEVIVYEGTQSIKDGSLIMPRLVENESPVAVK